MKLRGIFLFTGIILLSLRLQAQTGSVTVSGIIIDGSSKAPLEFVNVQLLKTDSSVIKATATDHKGRFTIDDIPVGNYLLRCTYIGYGKIVIPVVVNSGQKIKLGTLEIRYQSADMNEVVVTSKKSMLNTQIDRKVYNVAQDIMAQSGSASDILKNVPSVEVDIDGQVSLRGSTEVMILINGRPSPLMGKSRAEVLQQLPANSIERIEVITNPSARYKPDGTSGIINIVLKKNIKGGWNGNITASAGNRERYNSSVNLNYKPGKLNLFGNYSIRQDSRLRLNNVSREYLDTITLATKSYYTEDGNSVARPLSHLATLGAEYNPDKFNSLGISGNYSSRNFTRHDIVTKYFYDNNHLLTSNYDRLRTDPEWQKEKDATLFWEHNFRNEDHTLRIEVNASQSQEQEDNHYTNQYHTPSTYNSFDNTLIRQGDNQQQVSVDYSKPLSENSRLEAGYAGSFVQQDFDFYGAYYDVAAGKFMEDKQKTNRFLYYENIHALYGTYQRSYEKFSYSLGLRLEQAYIKGNQVIKDSVIRNDYFRIYPTLHLAWKLKTGELQLNYSRRVHRPEGDDINPFPEYQDPYNVRAGNPKLLPEIIHSVETGYKWQDKNFSFVPSLYYRYKQNGFTSVTLPLNDTVLLSSMQNLSNDQSAGLELIFSAKAGSFFSANLSNNIFYNLIDASNLGYTSRKSIISMSTNFNSTFTITKNTMLQVSCNYRSARLTPQGKNYASFVLNSGIRQDLFKKKLSVTLTASDLLQTLKQKTEINSPYFKQVSTGTRDARVIYIGMSYRFGKVIKKQAEEKMQFDNGL